MAEKKLWLVIYNHKHGIDAWPVWRPFAGTQKSLEKTKARIEKDTIKALEEEYGEPFDSEREWVEVRGPFPLPE
jgi:hypothetical protein